MVPGAWVQEAACKLVQQHGADAMTEVARLLSLAVTRQEAGAVLTMVRVGCAVADIHPKPNGSLRDIAEVLESRFRQT